jgi:hypothetical protein
MCAHATKKGQMAFIFRSMLPDGDKPAIGPSAKKLGVRVGLEEKSDIPVDDQSNVSPKTGGMSVAPSWRDLPAHRIPRALNSIVRDACGDDRLFVWRFGDAQFVGGPLSDRLALRLENEKHGLVEPASKMSLAVFCSALAATRDTWKKIEDYQ